MRVYNSIMLDNLAFCIFRSMLCYLLESSMNGYIAIGRKVVDNLYFEVLKLKNSLLDYIIAQVLKIST